MKISYFVSLFLLLFGITSFITSEARVRLAVSLTHEIGHDRNMVLKSELHSIERVFEGKRISLDMQEGVRFDFDARFIQREQDYGPSPFVQIRGDLYDYQGRLLKKLTQEEGEIKIGGERHIVHEYDRGRRVEILIKPEVNE